MKTTLKKYHSSNLNFSYYIIISLKIHQMVAKLQQVVAKKHQIVAKNTTSCSKKYIKL
jgi:hypothetical protein